MRAPLMRGVARGLGGEDVGGAGGGRQCNENEDGEDSMGDHAGLFRLLFSGPACGALVLRKRGPVSRGPFLDPAEPLRYFIPRKPNDRRAFRPGGTIFFTLVTCRLNAEGIEAAFGE